MKHIKSYNLFESTEDTKEDALKVADCLQELFDDYDIVYINPHAVPTNMTWSIIPMSVGILHIPTNLLNKLYSDINDMKDSIKNRTGLNINLSKHNDVEHGQYSNITIRVEK